MKKVRAKIEFEIDLVQLYNSDDLPEFTDSKGNNWKYNPNLDIWGSKDENNLPCIKLNTEKNKKKIDLLNFQLKHWVADYLYEVAEEYCHNIVKDNNVPDLTFEYE